MKAPIIFHLLLTRHICITSFVLSFPSANEDIDGVPAKRKKEDEEEEGVVLEMQENVENPLRCPVRLYEFYLSKWYGSDLGDAVFIIHCL